MIRFLLITCALLTVLPHYSVAQNGNVAIIPQPNLMVVQQTTFELSAATVIVYDKKTSKKDIAYLQKQIQRETGLTLKATKKRKAENVIRFVTDYSVTIPDNGYQLFVRSNEIEIRGNFAGHFYAIQSLLQLIRKENSKIFIPVTNIMDHPRFPWRGMHLDVVRHFFEKQDVKNYLSWMARYKMNVFHWHLTDDQGWRIEIKKWPRLTSVGAYRNGTLKGHYTESPDVYDTTRYGGFYTQNDIREIVRYADSLHITIVPEIEMPGHVSALLAAYPELACTPGPFEVQRTWGVFDDVLCPSEKTFSFLQDVLDEVCKLFPGKYIHIGGDEAPKVRWKNSTYCQSLIKQHQLKDENGLQSWFVQRIVNYLQTKGKRAIGWDEILDGGLAKGAAVMSWRGEQGGLDAALAGHYAVMTPGSHCYFDHYQSAYPTEPLAFGGYTTVEKVYSYEPVPKILPKEKHEYILGTQGNVWTEYIPDFSQVQYMIFPRMLALAEVGWTQPGNKNWTTFKEKLPIHFSWMEREGIRYSRAVYDLKFIPKPNPNAPGILLHIETPDGLQAQYHIGKDQTMRTYVEPIPLQESTIVYAVSAKDELPVGAYNTYNYWHHLGSGNAMTLTKPPHQQYSNGGAFTLTDGITGNLPWKGSEWLGFLGEDLTAIYDFQKPTAIGSIRVISLADEGSWIHGHRPVQVFTSEDGITYKAVRAKKVNSGFAQTPPLQEAFYQCQATTRYLKVVVPNSGIIPDGKPGAGHRSWLFVSEIIIE